ncbi:MAG: FG-GAP repeat domain-containing protein, partial [Candidatus Hodarchaeota archaeon]
LIVGTQRGELLFFENIGNHTYPMFNGYMPLQVGTEVLDVGTWAAPHAIDWNGDGKLDLLVGNFRGEILYFRNNGTTTQLSLTDPVLMQEGNSNLDLGAHAHPFCIDWDEDGLLDIIAGDSHGHLRWYQRKENDDISLRPVQFIKNETDGAVTVSERAKPYIFDWNEDNQLDLIVGDASGQIYLFLAVGGEPSSSSSNSFQSPLLTPGFLFAIPLLSVVGIILWKKIKKIKANNSS